MPGNGYPAHGQADALARLPNSERRIPMVIKAPGPRRCAALTVIALAATLVASACASTSKGSTSVDAAAGSPVKLMATGILNTPAANFTESVNGAEAAAAAINKAGGINGHPIEIITCNDNLNAADAIGCARGAVADP